jgi:TolB-like protein
MSLIEELKRRNVFRVGVAYGIVAWLLVEVASVVLPTFRAPEWVMPVFTFLVILGFPVAVFLAWAYELTPEGVKLEAQVDRAQSITRQTGRKLDRAIIVALGLAVAFLLYQQFGANKQDSHPEQRSEPYSVVGKTQQVAPIEETVPSSSSSLPTIAVLPFVNMSSDPEQEYFSDGITEEILNRLAGIRGLQVAARTSVFAFKGQNQDVREIAQKLGVGNILEGSVRKAGEQVRITAQLIRASDGFHLWSEAYDRKLENIFAIQDDIASQIAEALQISLGVPRTPAAYANERVNPEAYDLYLRARTLHRKRGRGLLQAIELFEQALAIDPNFAPAWAGLSHSYIVVINYVFDNDRQKLGDVGAKSMVAAEKALQLDPNLPTALHALANNLLLRFEWERAEEYYLRALELDPDSADIMEDYASLLTYSWQLDAARKVTERMIELDPKVPIFLLVSSWAHHAAGEFEMRDKYVKAALDINPDLRNIQFQKLIRLLEHGQLDDARSYAREMDRGTKNPQTMLQLVDWMSHPEREPNLAVLEALSIGARPALMADRYDVWLGAVEKSGAIWPEWELVATINLLAPVVAPELMHQYRADPRTKAYLSRLRLPEYWRKVGWPEPCQPVGDDDFECH